MYPIKLNLIKCAFRVTLKKFIRFIVSHWGIEANIDKIRAMQEMSPPMSVKEVQHLIDKITTLNHFASKFA